MSRTKGRRAEQELVLYLYKLGYKAERILRQYQEAGQPDVKAEKDGKTLTFESKFYFDKFKAIYSLYYSERDSDGLLCFVIGRTGTPVAISSDLSQLIKVDRTFRNIELFPPNPEQKKVYERIVKMKELKQAADFLVIRDNQKPRLFLRYW